MKRVTERARRVIGDNLGVEEKTLMPEARFREDLGAESLDLVELMMEMEKEFGCDFDDDEAERVHTLQEAVALIATRKGIK